MKFLLRSIVSVLMLALLNPTRAETPASPLYGPIHIEKGPVQPTWESMAQHYHAPDWFRDGKIAVWMHWGIPSAIDENRPNDGSHYGRRMYGTNGYDGRSDADRRMTETLTEWHTKQYGPPSERGYEKLIPLFKAERWDPDALVKFFKECGVKFIMPVATHHDNFDMYDSSFPWNSVKMGPHRDTLKEWKAAATKYGLTFGVSTHLYWSPRFFNTARQYQKPGTPAWQLFNMDYDPKNYASQDSWNDFWYNRCWELISKYDPDWFNNDAPFPDEKRGKSLGLDLFASYLNRDLKENNGRQTVVLSFKKADADKAAFTYNLESGMSGEIQKYPWMWATDIAGGWLYRKDARPRMSLPVLIGNIVDTVSKNGVAMINVGLRGDGTLPESQAAYLTAIGDFVKINGEAIYGARPWKVFGEGPTEISSRRGGQNTKPYTPQDIRITTKDDNLYAFVLAPPTKDILIKTLATGGSLAGEIVNITLLGSHETLHWTRSPAGLTITKPETLPGQYAIAFRITIK